MSSVGQSLHFLNLSGNGCHLCMVSMLLTTFYNSTSLEIESQDLVHTYMHILCGVHEVPTYTHVNRIHYESKTITLLCFQGGFKDVGGYKIFPLTIIWLLVEKGWRRCHCCRSFPVLIITCLMWLASSTATSSPPYTCTRTIYRCHSNRRCVHYSVTVCTFMSLV